MDTKLPQELIDYIIDYLHGEKTSLLWCSLVGKAWTASSHYHLFHTISFDYPMTNLPGQCSAFAALLVHTLDAFLTSHLTKRIRHYVRELHLKAREYTFEVGPALRALPLSVLQSVFDQLPSMHTLELDGINPPNPSEYLGQQHTRPKLRTLRLLDQSYQPHFTSLLSFIEQIDLLKVSAAVWLMRQGPATFENWFLGPRPHIIGLHIIGWEVE